MLFKLLKSAPRCFSVMLVVCCMFLAHGSANAQNPQLDCDADITDPDQKWTAELCSAHAGCKLVFAIQKGCVKTKRFLTGLRDAIGEGTKSLFGYRKEITPDAVFEASLSDNLKAGSAKPEIAENAKIIKEKVRSAGNTELSGQGTNGTTWKYYGDVVDGKATGVGTQIYSNGHIWRGGFVAGRSEGLAETVMPETNRRVGYFKEGRQNLEGALLTETGALFAGHYKEGLIVEGKLVLPGGARFEGTFAEGNPDVGKRYRANNTLESEGKYEKSTLVDGKSYDSSGKVTAVTILRDREAKVAADIAAANDRVRREREQEIASRAAADKQKADAMARDEQQFQASLNSLNVGQLFAKADEFKSQGDSAKSRDALRALIARFPNHALATTAAQQLSSQNRPPSASRDALAQPSNLPAGLPPSSATNKACEESVARDIKLYRPTIAEPSKYFNAFPHQMFGENFRRLASGMCANHPYGPRLSVLAGRMLDGAKRFDGSALPTLAELDSIGGGAVSATGSGGSCDTELARIGNTASQNQSKIGQGAVKGMELVLWSLTESISVIDKMCPTDSKYIAMRKSMQASLTTTKQSCDQMSTSTCAARLP